jgi:hypothetical protein
MNTARRRDRSKRIGRERGPRLVVSKPSRRESLAYGPNGPFATGDGRLWWD